MVVLWFSLYIFRCWFQVCSVPCGWYNETREIFGWSRSTASSTCLHRYSAVCGCLWSCKWLWFPYTWYIGIVDLISVFVAQCRIMGERSPLYRAWILWMVTWVIASFLKNHSHLQHLPWVSLGFLFPYSLFRTARCRRGSTLGCAGNCPCPVYGPGSATGQLQPQLFNNFGHTLEHT